MKLILPIILLFVSTVSAQTKIVPIADMRYSVLLGGVENGKWVKPEKVIPTLKDQTEFVIAGLKGVEEGGVTVGKKQDITGEVCDADYQTFEFDLKSETGVAIGSNAKWNPAPRIPQEISAESKEYQTIVKEFLKTNKITKSPVKIKQAFRVDLDGDGTDEVLISATNYKKGIIESQTVGDYSFVLLRKIVNKKVQNILVWGEFITKKEELPPPNVYEITGIADLNGDGKMEIVADSAYYEGASQTVFEIQGNKPVAVLEVGCGL
jgi:hypothetical protein